MIFSPVTTHGISMLGYLGSSHEMTSLLGLHESILTSPALILCQCEPVDNRLIFPATVGGDAQIVVALQIDPRFRAGAEVSAQSYPSLYSKNIPSHVKRKGTGKKFRVFLLLGRKMSDPRCHIVSGSHWRRQNGVSSRGGMDEVIQRRV